MIEIMELRDELMNELDHGFFDRDAWGALIVMARDAGCLNIAAQVERYFEHYLEVSK